MEARFRDFPAPNEALGNRHGRECGAASLPPGQQLPSQAGRSAHGVGYGFAVCNVGSPGHGRLSPRGVGRAAGTDNAPAPCSVRPAQGALRGGCGTRGQRHIGWSPPSTQRQVYRRRAHGVHPEGHRDQLLLRNLLTTICYQGYAKDGHPSDKGFHKCDARPAREARRRRRKSWSVGRGQVSLPPQSGRRGPQTRHIERAAATAGDRLPTCHPAQDALSQRIRRIAPSVRKRISQIQIVCAVQSFDPFSDSETRITNLDYSRAVKTKALSCSRMVFAINHLLALRAFACRTIPPNRVFCSRVCPRKRSLPNSTRITPAPTAERFCSRRVTKSSS